MARTASPKVVSPGAMLQKQGASQSTGFCNNVARASLASFGVRVGRRVGVIVGTGDDVTVGCKRGVKVGVAVEDGTNVGVERGVIVEPPEVQPGITNTIVIRR